MTCCVLPMVRCDKFSNFGQHCSADRVGWCVSAGGVIRLFDVWPPDQDASFQQLRAKGGFLISASLHSGQTETGISLLSEAGSTVTLQNPVGWTGGIMVEDSSGSSVQTTAGPVSEDGVLSWTWCTKKAETYTINMSA